MTASTPARTNAPAWRRALIGAGAATTLVLAAGLGAAGAEETQPAGAGDAAATSQQGGVPELGTGPVTPRPDVHGHLAGAAAATGGGANIAPVANEEEDETGQTNGDGADDDPDETTANEDGSPANGDTTEGNGETTEENGETTEDNGEATEDDETTDEDESGSA